MTTYKLFLSKDAHRPTIWFPFEWTVMLLASLFLKCTPYYRIEDDLGNLVLECAISSINKAS